MRSVRSLLLAFALCFSLLSSDLRAGSTLSSSSARLTPASTTANTSALAPTSTSTESLVSSAPSSYDGATWFTGVDAVKLRLTRTRTQLRTLDVKGAMMRHKKALKIAGVGLIIAGVVVLLFTLFIFLFPVCDSGVDDIDATETTCCFGDESKEEWYKICRSE